MVYEWFFRKRMPLTYLYQFVSHGLSFLPMSTFKTHCEWVLHKALFLVKTANLKVVANLGKCKNYCIFEIEDFLPTHVCDKLVSMADTKGVEASTIIDNRGDKVLDLFIRKSRQTWLKDEEDEEVARISECVANLTQLPVSHQEELQVVRYPSGGYYNAHFDASFHPDVIPVMNKGCGPRLYTVLIYLNDDFEGGETDFPEIGVTIKPKKGKAILFQNIDECQDLIPESMHAGCPVTKGTKWIANKWVRILPFELHSCGMTQNDDRRVLPRSLIIAKENLMAYNSIFIKDNKLNQAHVIEIPNFVAGASSQPWANIDGMLAHVLHKCNPLPVDKIDTHFTPLCTVRDKCHPMFGLPVLHVYLFTKTQGAIEFPYLRRKIQCIQDGIVVVVALDNTLQANVAASHIFHDCDLSSILVKTTMTVPVSFQSALNNVDAFCSQAANNGLSIVLRHGGKVNINRILYGYN